MSNARSNAALIASMCVTICSLHPLLAGPPVDAPARGSLPSITGNGGCLASALARSAAARPGEHLLRLRGGKNAAHSGVAADIDDALQVLDRYLPRHKRVVVRGMPKQARTSGAKKPVKKGSKKETKQETAARKRSEIPLHEAPWRWQADIENMQGDTGWYKGKQIEVRKRTTEGNHILRIGYVDSYKSRQAAQEKMRGTKQMQEGLWERMAAITELKKQIKEAKTSGCRSVPNEWGIVQTLPGSVRTLEVMQATLAGQERELVRYKDEIDGTSNWKNLTAHTGKTLSHARTHAHTHALTSTYPLQEYKN